MTDADLDYAYLTTTGRHTGRPHRIEIWFALVDPVVYLLAGGGDRADWVRNLQVSPDVVVEIGGSRRDGRARVVTDPDEDRLARRALLGKYAPRYHGDLTDWSETAVPVAIDLEGGSGGLKQ